MAAWRPQRNVRRGELDNTRPGTVTGWISFIGISEPVTLALAGDFHRDIRGAKLRLEALDPAEESAEARAKMEGFARHQTGAAGDITAGLPPQDYGDSPYIEWYSAENGRVVLEMDPKEVQVVGTPRPWQTETPVSRADQAQHMARFLSNVSRAEGVPAMVLSVVPAQGQAPEGPGGAAGATREFLVAAVSTNTGPAGDHGHILVARDGETYQAGLLRSNPGAPEEGEVVQAPVRGRQPVFSALGFAWAHRLEPWPFPVEWPGQTAERRGEGKTGEPTKGKAAAAAPVEPGEEPEPDAGPELMH